MHMIKRQAEELLAPFESLLYSIPSDAVSRYIRDFGDIRFQLGKRSDASIIHDLMIGLAVERLDALPEFSRMHNLGLHYYYASNGEISANIRFKKLNERMRSSNIPTNQAVLFNHQELQPELPNMPPLANITLGYTFNSTRTSAEAVFLTMPHGDRNIWTWRLQGRSPGQITHVPAAPSPTPSEDNISRAISEMSPKQQVDGS